MTLQKLGEAGLIEKINKLFAVQKPGLVGVGDDAAVIEKDATTSFVITKDDLVENNHFYKRKISAADLGHKILAINISDIAAMNAKPHYAFLSLALPKTKSEKWIDEFLAGFKKTADHFGILLLGGNCTGSEKIMISLTLIGTAATKNIKYRHTAKIGDQIFVTDKLGAAGAGFYVMDQNILAPQLTIAHHHPTPKLHNMNFASALMDISDGLDVDLRKLCTASQCGAEIDLSKIPIHADVQKFCALHNLDPLQFTLYGGEDYMLLGTSPAVPKEFPVIGKITKQNISYINGTLPQTGKKPFHHFGESA